MKQNMSKSKHWCVVPGCKLDTMKRGRLDKYPWMENITFNPLPTKLKQSRLRSKWVQLIRRPLDYEPLPHHRVCSRHFTEDGEVPELFEWNNFKIPQAKRPAISIMKREGARATVVNYTVTSSNRSEAASTENSSFNMDDHSYCHQRNRIDTTYRDEGSQTDLSLSDLQDIADKLEKLTDKMADKNALLRETFVTKVMENDQSISRYTGIPNKAIFYELSSITNEFEPNLKYWNGSESQENKKYQQTRKKQGPSRKLDRMHEFLITLLRLRLALLVYLLADLFGVSNTRVSSIFTTWIFYLNCIFKEMITWPSERLILKHMPKSFKKNFPRTRCIIDCSEIFIQGPRNPSLQCKTYSSYKSHNTYTFLVGITPTGAFSFISDIWGGNTSDRYITMNSGFLDMLSGGDEIMADRGKGKRLNASEIRKTRQIANHRIHVERAIQRLKTFKMLSHVLTLSIKSVVNPMIVVAAFLFNLMKPLVR